MKAAVGNMQTDARGCVPITLCLQIWEAGGPCNSVDPSALTPAVEESVHLAFQSLLLPTRQSVQDFLHFISFGLHQQYFQTFLKFKVPFYYSSKFQSVLVW